VLPAFQHWEIELEERFGYKKKATTDDMRGQATRDRFFFRSHKHDELDKWNKRLWEETEEEMGKGNGFQWETGKEWSRWPHREQCMEFKPPTQKTYYPTLVLRNGNPDDFDKLVEWERNFLVKMRIRDSRGDGFFAGVREVSTWMGLNEDEMGRIQEEFGCQQTIDRLQGKDKNHWEGHPFGPPEDAYTECGRKRFCVNCVEVLKCLGNAWNKKVAVEEYLKVMLPALKGTESYNYQKMKVHQCKERCSLIETLADAKNMEQIQNFKKKENADTKSNLGIIEI
jgi:hypothetical protein